VNEQGVDAEMCRGLHCSLPDGETPLADG